MEPERFSQQEYCDRRIGEVAGAGGYVQFFQPHEFQRPDGGYQLRQFWPVHQHVRSAGSAVECEVELLDDIDDIHVSPRAQRRKEKIVKPKPLCKGSAIARISAAWEISAELSKLF